MTREFLSTYNTPTHSGTITKAPLLCSGCGVVFGLSTIVADKAVIKCHHCQCPNEIHVEVQRDLYTGEAKQKVIVTSTDTPAKDR